ncbi:hypothetical protein K239x_27620 [Planctomycetes bacterium K23_9]|uniref:Uncharacterized protein n=1 Tax=Stieleria marina TaxID=1930275 RepID=A0A517NUH0_9BACT|nr:hypothetical protein K239x_27620 [Planctomycetes bacterium K23_9]
MDHIAKTFWMGRSSFATAACWEATLRKTACARFEQSADATSCPSTVVNPEAKSSRVPLRFRQPTQNLARSEATVL